MPSRREASAFVTARTAMSIIRRKVVEYRLIRASFKAPGTLISSIIYVGSLQPRLRMFQRGKGNVFETVAHSFCNR